MSIRRLRLAAASAAIFSVLGAAPASATLTAFSDGSTLYASQLNPMVQATDLVTDLRGFVGGIVVQVSARGRASVGDGLGGAFYWSATSSAIDDGATVIKPAATTGNGRWLLLPTNPAAFNSYTGSTNLATLGTVTAGTWNATTIGAGFGGTGCSAAAGSCLDNITGFASTGLLNRTGAGAYSFVSTSAQLAGSLSDETGTGSAVFATSPALVSPTVTGSFTAVGLVTNSDLVNPATTVNGVVCSLGSTCTITAASSGLTVGGTTISSGASNGLFYDAAGVLGNLATANNGVLVTNGSGVPSVSSALPSGLSATGMLLTTPNIGVASGASLSLGTAGFVVGSQSFTNLTSGSVTLQPVTGALGSTVLTLPAASGTVATLSNNLGSFAATTSAQLAAVLSDETGTGSVVYSNSPSLVTPNIGAATGTTLGISGQFTSSLATGTAPFVVASTTNVPNLNASSLAGATFAAPGAIGGTTAGTGKFTTLAATSTGSLTLGTAGSAVGQAIFDNATSGSITLAPPTGALGSAVLTMPAATDTLAALAATQTFSNKTFSGATTFPSSAAITAAGVVTLPATTCGNVNLSTVYGEASATKGTFGIAPILTISPLCNPNTTTIALTVTSQACHVFLTGENHANGAQSVTAEFIIQNGSGAAASVTTALAAVGYTTLTAATSGAVVTFTYGSATDITGYAICSAFT